MKRSATNTEFLPGHFRLTALWLAVTKEVIENFKENISIENANKLAMKVGRRGDECPPPIMGASALFFRNRL
jgi:hypothetical protein